MRTHSRHSIWGNRKLSHAQSKDKMMKASDKAGVEAHQILMLKQRMLEDMPFMYESLLGRFLLEAMKNDDFVKAYATPRFYRHEGEQQCILPYEMSMKAAAKAKHATILRDEYREIAFLAAFLWPCGLYQCVQTQESLASASSAGISLSREDATRYMLEDAFRMLRRQNPGMSDTLARSLDLILDGDFDHEATAGVMVAIRMTNIRVREIWKLNQ